MGERRISVRFFFRVAAIYKSMGEAVRKQKFRLLGAYIGKSVKLGNVFMPVPEQVSVADKCVIEDHVRFRAGGAWKKSSISVGTDTFIGHSTQINVGTHFKVGNKCMIAPLCIFSDAHHSFESLEIPIKDQKCIYNPIVVEDDVWIGTGSVVLGGVTIHKGAIIASGAVVNRDVPSYEIWGGVPAKKLKSRLL